MPEFETYVDVDVDDFISACSKREIKTIIDILVEDGHINEPIIITSDEKMGLLETMFLEKMGKLSGCYYRLTPEDEKTLEKLFEKYV
jgi:hypothetical protein